jgi:hypothetical protein
MNEDEEKLLEQIENVIYSNKKVNDHEVCQVLRILLEKHSPIEG